MLFLPTCRGGGMADATDLKSVVRKGVRVRLPPSAPTILESSLATDSPGGLSVWGSKTGNGTLKC